VKMYLSRSKSTPSNIKYLPRKNILLLLSYTYYTKHARFCVPLPVSVIVSIVHFTNISGETYCHAGVIHID